jgi:hypothetical protein
MFMFWFQVLSHFRTLSRSAWYFASTNRFRLIVVYLSLTALTNVLLQYARVLFAMLLYIQVVHCKLAGMQNKIRPLRGK